MVNKEKVLSLLKQIFKDRFRKALFMVVVAVFGFVGWRTLVNKKQQPQYQTAKVERGTIVSSVSVSGQILSSNIVNVTTQASGVVKKIYVQDGDTVSAGQKIMEIALDSAGQQRNASAWSSYLSAKNSLESAKVTQYSLQSDMFSKWKTFKDLAESSSYDTPEERDLPQFRIAENDWLVAEAKYKNQQNVIVQTQAALNNTWFSYQMASPVVTAPIAGIISSFSVVEGMSIGEQSNSSNDSSQSQKIAVIQNQANSLATFNLSEIDVSQVEPGKKATITLDSFPEKTFTGKVVSVDSVGMITSGVTNYPVIIQLDTSSEQILPNMAATAEIIAEIKEDVLWVPPQAVKTQAGQTAVRVLVNGKSQEKQVEVGLETSSQAEIITGLSEGETIVVSEITVGEETTFGGGGGMRGIMPGGFGGERR